MISREDFDRLQEEFNQYAAQLREKDRHGRGGTTVSEAMDPAAFVEASIALMQDPEYIRKTVRRRLEYLMGEPDEDRSGGSLGNPYGLGINSLDDEFHPQDPAVIGAFAARHYKERKAQNRLKALREFADLCRSLADAFEKRLEEESRLRRIQ